MRKGDLLVIKDVKGVVVGVIAASSGITPDGLIRGLGAATNKTLAVSLHDDLGFALVPLSPDGVALVIDELRRKIVEKVS